MEDTSVTLADIIQRFGNDIGEIVAGLTDPPEIHDWPTLKRKLNQVERVRKENNRVRRVKLADQISNARCLANDVDRSPDWKNPQKCLDWLEGARQIAESCRDVSAFLDEEFDKTYQKAIRNIQ